MAASAVTLEWVRPPRQARSQATLDRLLDAAEDLLGEKGWEDTSVAEIASRAGSSVGSFYARFHDKVALLNALHERFVQEAYATTDQALDPARWQGATIEAITTELVRFQVGIHSQRVALFRALILQTVSDADFQARAALLNGHIYERFLALLLERKAELLHPAPAAAAEFMLRLVSGVLQQQVLFAPMPDALTRMSKAQLTEELTHACLAYLGVFSESSEA